jgi:hypothetical protein
VYDTTNKRFYVFESGWNTQAGISAVNGTVNKVTATTVGSVVTLTLPSTIQTDFGEFVGGVRAGTSTNGCTLDNQALIGIGSADTNFRIQTSGGTTFYTGSVTETTVRGDLHIQQASSPNARLGFRANASMVSDKIYTWPAADGTSGQPLVTNGAGVLSFGQGFLGGGFSPSCVEIGSEVNCSSPTFFHGNYHLMGNQVIAVAHFAYVIVSSGSSAFDIQLPFPKSTFFSLAPTSGQLGGLVVGHTGVTPVFGFLVGTTISSVNFATITILNNPFLPGSTVLLDISFSYNTD